MIETFLFGGPRGYGESVLIKFSPKSYGIIDSFRNPKTKQPRVLEFLKDRRIDLSYVDFVLLTHCHKDHFTGIADILKECANAEFFTSQCIGIKEFKFLISCYKNSNINSKFNYFSEIIELFDVLKRTNRRVKLVSKNSSPIYLEGGYSIKTIAPNENTKDFLRPVYKKQIKDFLNSNQLKVPLSTQGYNFQSVVVILESEKFSFLFGGDLEFHPNNNSIGWKEIEDTVNFEPVDIFKIPHHGSQNGYNPDFWQSILSENCILKLTPFARSELPRIEMVENIKKHGEAYMTANPKGKYKKNMPGRLKKKTQGLEIKRVRSDLAGVINFVENAKWEIDVILEPNALKL